MRHISTTVVKSRLGSWISVNVIPSWQYKQGNCGPPYDTNALQRTNCDPWAMNKKFRIHMLQVTHTRFSSPVITVAQRKFSNMGNFLNSWFCFLSVAEMEVTRDDTSQSLSMTLKQKDSKIGLLTQNLQQQEGENMAMEAKLVFRSMKPEKEKNKLIWSPRENRSRTLAGTDQALFVPRLWHYERFIFLYFITERNLHHLSSFFIAIITLRWFLPLTMRRVHWTRRMFFRMEDGFNRGRISSVGKVLDCRAGDGGPDQY